ncbi:MAG: CarD family transcriptional regulator [Gaiella sp.]
MAVNAADVAVGDTVVYSIHGLGRVVGRKRRRVQGAMTETVILQFDEGGLTVSLPLERAREQLRRVVNEVELGEVQDRLRGLGTVSDESWLTRQRHTLAKLNRGLPPELAEIVRDAAAREQKLTAKGTKTVLSPGEREVSLRARQLLAEEIGHVRGVSSTEAADWIDQQLPHAG